MKLLRKSRFFNKEIFEFTTWTSHIIQTLIGVAQAEQLKPIERSMKFLSNNSAFDQQTIEVNLLNKLLVKATKATS